MNPRIIPLAALAAAVVVLSGCAAGIDRRHDRREDRRDDRQDRREDRRDFISQGPSGSHVLTVDRAQRLG
ncbi:MAG: hypothetical protein WAQ05_00585 [Rubrivivax sp.]